VSCEDVYEGSVVVVFFSESETNLMAALTNVDSNGLDLPSFPKIIPSCDAERHCSGHGQTRDNDTTDGCECNCDTDWYDDDCGAQLCDSERGLECLDDCVDYVECRFPGCANVTENCMGGDMEIYCTIQCQGHLECFEDWEDIRDSCSAGMGFNVIVTVTGVAESQTVQVGVNKNGEMAGTVELSEHENTGIVPNKFVYDSEYDAFIKVTPTGHECEVTNPTGTIYNHHIIYVVCTFTRTSVLGSVSNLNETITGLDMELNLTLASGEYEIIQVVGNSAFEFSLKAEFWREYYVTVKSQPNQHYCNISFPTYIIAEMNTVVNITCYEHPRCERDAHCSGHGDTTDDFKFDGCECVCDEGWGSHDCSTVKCQAETDCNGRGTTFDEDNSDGCDCFCELWTGPDCSIAPPCNDIQHCNAHGTTTDLDATDGCVCDCDPDWAGASDCSIPVCKADIHCNANGVTSDLNSLDGCVCECFDGFLSDPLSEIQCTIPPPCNFFTDCNNHGTTIDLDATDGCVCNCQGGWRSNSSSGIQCTIPPVCDDADCFNRGTTTDLDRTDGCECTCDEGWDSESQCEDPLPCDPSVYLCANGVMEDTNMVDGCVCTCNEGWWPGDDCNTRTCDADLHCSSHGSTSDSDPSDGCTCTCDPDWNVEPDCSIFCPYHCTPEHIGDGFCDDGAFQGDDPNYPDCRTCPFFYLDDVFDRGDCITANPTLGPSAAPVVQFPEEYFVLYLTFTGHDDGLAALNDKDNRTVIIDRLEEQYDVHYLYYVETIEQVVDGIKTVELVLASPIETSSSLAAMPEITRQVKASQAVSSYGITALQAILEAPATSTSPTKSPTTTTTTTVLAEAATDYSTSEQFFAENWIYVIIAVAVIVLLVLYYSFTRKTKAGPAVNVLAQNMPPPPHQTSFAPGPTPASWQHQMTPGYDNVQRNLYANRYEKLGRRPVPQALNFPPTTAIEGEPSLPDFRVGESVKFREPPAYHWVYGTVFNSVEKEGDVHYWVEYTTPSGIDRRRLVLQQNLSKDTDRNDLLYETQETPGEIYQPPLGAERVVPSPLGTRALAHAGYRVGDRVQVYSKSRRQWFDADVCQLLSGGKMLVRYRMNNFLFEKKIKCDDENMVRPEGYRDEEISYE